MLAALVLSPGESFQVYATRQTDGLTDRQIPNLYMYAFHYVCGQCNTAEQLWLLTISDRFKKLGNTVALGELARVADGAGAHEPEEHAECVDVDAAIILGGQEFRCHVQWCADHTAGHHRRRFAETKVSELAAILKVQLLTTANGYCHCHVYHVTYFYLLHLLF